MRKKRVLSALVACGMLATMATPAFAMPGKPPVTGDNGQIGGAIPTGNGTEVWAGVAVDEPDARIKVTVPTLFAFVVNGTVDTQTANQAVTVANDGLLLPNVKVTGASADATSQKYNIETVGDASELDFRNYSTWLTGDAKDKREGMAVNITGTIKNEGSEDSRNGWTHVATAPSNAAATDLKHYQIGVAVAANDADKNGTIADDEYTWFGDVGNGLHGMASDKAISLAAPDLTNNLDQETNLAINPSITPVNFNVKVGGTRGDYTVVENSAKVGTITWSVSTPEASAGVK